MAINYTKFSDIAKTYTQAYKDSLTNITAIGVLNAHITSKLTAASESSQLQSNIKALESWITKETSNGDALGLTQLGNYLLGDGKIELGSVSTTAALVAADLALYMTRDAQTVLENGIGQSDVTTGAGNGVATLVQDQQTKNDTITMTCTDPTGTAKFSVVSEAEGTLKTDLEADGVDTFASPLAGIVSLVITTGGTPWALNDKVVFTTTSDDVSTMLTTFRDKFGVLLPTSGTPTISNSL